MIAGLLLTGAGAALAATSYYDKNGFYQGKKSDDGSFNDRNGFYQGKMCIRDRSSSFSISVDVFPKDEKSIQGRYVPS